MATRRRGGSANSNSPEAKIKTESREDPIAEPAAFVDSTEAEPIITESYDRWNEAIDYLRKVDRRFGPLADRVGPCRLSARPDRFGTLVRAIVGQQISSLAARKIDAKLRALGGSPHDPHQLIKLGEPAIRSAGLSGMKARYVLNLAEAVVSGQVPLDRFDEEDDQTIVKQLTSVKGIGVWTAEMFLIFALNRPDVMPSLDLGVRMGVQKYFELAETPPPKRCFELAEPWRPFRTVAVWYIWEDHDN